MIPENRLSSTPVLGPLINSTVPNNLLVSSEYGGIALYDASAGLQVKPWTLQYDRVSQNVTLSADGVPTTVLFNRPSITQVSIAFDRNMFPFVAFVQAGQAKLYFYDDLVPGFVFWETELGTATYPRCTHDDKRRLQSASADIILAYIKDGTIKYRQQRDRYLIERELPQGVAGPTVSANILYHVGMNSNYRLQFLYGTTPHFWDTAIIMKQQVLSQKASAEVLDIVFNFQHTMQIGDVISAATAVITLESGTDPDPTSMLIGEASFTEVDVIQTVAGGIPGNVYRIAMSAKTINNCIYVVEGLLAINSSEAVEPE